MAEFCKECFKELLCNDYEDSQITLSEDLDLCEGCADFKQVVVRIKTCWDCTQRIGEECGIDGHEVYIDRKICDSFDEK